MPHSSWLTVFMIWPSPMLGPTTCRVEASRSSTGLARSRVSSAAPTMISRSPEPARSAPPLTGASTSPTPRSARRAAAARTPSTPTVLVTTTTAPSASASAAPAPISPPNRQDSNWAWSRTATTTTSAPVAASAGLVAGVAPACAASSRRGAAMSKARTGRVSASRLAMGRPIAPRPSTATVGVAGVVLDMGAAPGSVRVVDRGG